MPQDRIISNPAVMLGKPCVRGVRITVQLIQKWLAAGRTFGELREALHLGDEDIRAALAFASSDCCKCT
jgi:uncharacterized protein (DUF433 family)